MKIDWDAQKTFDDWAATLQQLLEQAQRGLQAGDVGGQVETQNLLLDFIKNSPNATAGILDEIAKRAINDIFRTAIDQALAGLSSRTAELAMHVKTIKAVTQEATTAAQSIRLERATKVVGSATQIVRELNELKIALSAAADDQALASKIEKAVKSIQEVVPLAMNLQPVP